MVVLYIHITHRTEESRHCVLSSSTMRISRVSYRLIYYKDPTYGAIESKKSKIFRDFTQVQVKRLLSVIKSGRAKFRSQRLLGEGNLCLERRSDFNMYKLLTYSADRCLPTLSRGPHFTHSVHFIGDFIQHPELSLKRYLALPWQTDIDNQLPIIPQGSL